jgi:hypothetical protein
MKFHVTSDDGHGSSSSDDGSDDGSSGESRLLQEEPKHRAGEQQESLIRLSRGLY